MNGKPVKFGLGSWEFSPLEAPPETLQELARWTLVASQGDVEVDSEVLRSFLASVSSGYLPNPYHNYRHAVDVAHTLFMILQFSHLESVFSHVQVFSLQVAAIAHDIGHPGYNNQFLIETRDQLSLLYNDFSPLENMHSCKLFWIMKHRYRDVFACLDTALYKESRNLVIEAILHTDMARHGELQNMLEEMAIQGTGVPWQKISPHNLEYLKKPENTQTLLKSLLHWADISNPTKPWRTADGWADRALEEFFRQGEKEKSLGIPVQPLNDRNLVRKPKSQMDFIEFCVAPCLRLQLCFFSEFSVVAIRCNQNYNIWKAECLADSRYDRTSRYGRTELFDRTPAFFETLAKSNGRQCFSI